MSPDKYRQNARRCLDLSKQVRAGRASRGFLDMAAGWLRLAEQAEKNQTTDLVYAPPPQPQQPVGQQQQQIQPRPEDDDS